MKIEVIDLLNAKYENIFFEIVMLQNEFLYIS